MNDAQYRALKHVRRSKQGIYLGMDIATHIDTVRERYESEPSSEYTRLLLVAYKRIQFSLFFKELK